MELRTRTYPGSHVVTVEVGGEIDIESGRRPRDRLCSMVWAHGPWLAVGLTGVTFIDCSGLSAPLAARRLAGVRSGRLRLVAESGCAPADRDHRTAGCAGDAPARPGAPPARTAWRGHHVHRMGRIGT
jgi:anti-anti-sigma factor